MTRTYITIRVNIRLYADGCIREFMGEGATPGNGDDVLPGERMVRLGRVQEMELTVEDRATLERWNAEQEDYNRRATA